MKTEHLVRALYPYGAERHVLLGPARGMKFVVERGMGFTYAVGTQAAAPRFFQRHVRRGMAVFDVGANRGQMALLFAALVGSSGCVAAFEPAPGPFASLARNARLNKLSHVRLFPIAVSDVHGELAFAYQADHPTEGKLLDPESMGTISGADILRIRAVPLDEMADVLPAPDVIKIDVEGAGARVLRGASRLLDRVGPAVYIELHGPEEQAGVRDELIARGYVVETLAGRRVHDPAGAWNNPLWCHRP